MRCWLRILWKATWGTDWTNCPNAGCNYPPSPTKACAAKARSKSRLPTCRWTRRPNMPAKTLISPSASSSICARRWTTNSWPCIRNWNCPWRRCCLPWNATACSSTATSWRSRARSWAKNCGSWKTKHFHWPASRLTSIRPSSCRIFCSTRWGCPPKALKKPPAAAIPPMKACWKNWRTTSPCRN